MVVARKSFVAVADLQTWLLLERVLWLWLLYVLKR